MFHRVPMDVIQMAGKIILIADEVFPIPGLPEFNSGRHAQNCAASNVLSLPIATGNLHHLLASAKGSASDLATKPMHLCEMGVPFAPFVLPRAVPCA